MICKMIMDGKRDPHAVATILQRIVDGIPDAFTRIWKTIEIGTGPQTGVGLLSRLARGEYQLAPGVCHILKSPDFAVSAIAQKIDLVRLTVEQLGFTKRTAYAAICKRAQEYALGLCPSDVAPQLLFQYETQPNNDYFFVASKPIACADGCSRILGIYREKDTRILEGFRSNVSPRDGGGFDPNHEFVFVLPKQGSDE